MAGRFVGLSDLEWKLFEDVMTKVGEKWEQGMLHAPFQLYQLPDSSVL